MPTSRYTIYTELRRTLYRVSHRPHMRTAESALDRAPAAIHGWHHHGYHGLRLLAARLIDQQPAIIRQQASEHSPMAHAGAGSMGTRHGCWYWSDAPPERRRTTAYLSRSINDAKTPRKPLPDATSYASRSAESSFNHLRTTHQMSTDRQLSVRPTELAWGQTRRARSAGARRQWTRRAMATWGTASSHRCFRSPTYAEGFSR